MITYSSPIITQDPDRPIPYENKGFPYLHILDPRRYEELIYCIYKNELRSGAFKSFDSISLLSGTSDLGMDCVLVKNSRNHGLIQCKRYDKNLSKEEVGLEITKFVMYSIIYPELIYDPEDFTYFIASAKGFANTCISFLNHFKEQISEDASLDKLISKLLKNPDLQALSFLPVKDKVLAIFKKINIKMISSNDLDLLLVQERNFSVVNLFFKVRTITDVSGIKRLEKKLDYILSKKLSSADIIGQLQVGSATIGREKNYFEGIKDSHIERTETAELVEWLSAPIERTANGRAKNLCLLAGNAGLGKTVIIRDTYDILNRQGVPVLALKADKIYAANIKELQDKIGIGIGVQQLIEECLEHFPNLVIMIDQIDALSQALSGKRDFLNTYTQLISIYKDRENIRIVVSVRIFDLYYDPSLRIYKDLKSIEVQPLSKELLLMQLQKLGVREKQLSASLFELLRIPNNLDVFSRIFRKRNNFSGLNSLQDLYLELYKIKILKPVVLDLDISKLKFLLTRLVELMYQSQQITVPHLLVEDYTVELDYLSSERIIKLEGSQIQFFHQTFYDFLYARYFTAKKLSIMGFIRNSGQSIMIRSGLKMILNFTRETNIKLYEQYIRQILENRSFYFHIKHLIITLISIEEKPTEAEKKIFRELILTNYDFLIIFSEHLMGRDWISYLMDNHFLEVLTTETPSKIKYAFDPFVAAILPSGKKREKRLENLSRIMIQMLKRNVPSAELEILAFCRNMHDLSSVIWLLFNVKNWRNKTAIKLFEKCFPANHRDHHGFYMILEQIAHVDPTYAFEKIKSELSMVDEKRKNNLRVNDSEKLLKTIGTATPDIFISHLTDIVINEGRMLPDEENSGIIRIYNTKDILKKKADLKASTNIYKLLALALKQEADQHSVFFEQYLEEHINHMHDSILKLLVFALLGNEAFYSRQILSLFNHLKNHNGLSHYDDLNEGFRRLLAQTCGFLSEEEMTRLLEAILTIRNPAELKYLSRKVPNESYYPRRFDYTKYQYLCTLPIAFLTKHSYAYLAYDALYRKFGPLAELDGYYFGPARGPITESAYEKMNFNNWIGSFEKYNSNQVNSRSIYGGLYEHAEKFGETVKKDLSKYDVLMRETIFNERINLVYTIKALQTLEGHAEDLPSLVKYTISRLPKGNDLYFLVQIAGRLISSGKIDNTIFQFVLSTSQAPVRLSGTPADESKYRNAVHAQERAIEALMHVTEKALANVIFERLERAMADSDESIQKTIMTQSAHLLSLDEQRAIELFVRNMDKLDSIKKFNSSCWSLSYLVHRGFQRFIPLIDRAIAFGDEAEYVSENLSKILISCCYYKYLGSEDIFWKFFNNGQAARSAALSTAFEYFYWKDEINAFNLKILYAAIRDNSKKVRHRFKIKFLHIEHIAFNDIREWLFAYVQSKSFTFSDYFLEYLIRISSTNAKVCIDLFDLAIHNKEIFKDKESNDMRSDDNTTKFIVAAYNALPIDEHVYRKKLLKMFDKVLLDIRFRQNAENILDKIL